MNLGYNEVSISGFHDPYRAMPKSIDETRTLTLQISTDGENWSTFDELHPTEYIITYNIHDESGLVGKTIKGNIIAPIELESNIQYRLRATDGTKYSTISFLNVSKKNRFTGATISGTKYLTQTEHDYPFTVQLTPVIASEVPTYNWSIRSVGDMDRYEVENTVGYSRVIRRSDNEIMVELLKNNRNQVNITVGTNLMNAKNNDTSFTVVCNVLGSYGSEVEATYDVIGHPEFIPRAVQSYDPEESNYNPALIIYLKNNEATTGVTLHEEAFENGSRGFYMTQQEAATITNLGTINGLTQIQDSNGYCVESYEDGVLNPDSYYRFTEFNEWKYFTSYNMRHSRFGDCSYLKEITLPRTSNNNGDYNAWMVIPAGLTELTLEEGITDINRIQRGNQKTPLNLHLPSTFGSSWSFMDGGNNTSFGNIYYNGTIEQWAVLNINRYSGNSAAQKYFNNLYCKGELITNISGELLSNYKNCIAGFKSITSITGNITSLQSYMFYRCSNLQSVTLANTITTIPEYCFGNCSALNFPTIPPHITSIAANAFSGSGASFSEIPDSITSFGSQSNMPNITAISYPNTMSAPGGFTGCANLSSVFFRKNDGDLEYNVTSMPNFNNSNRLTKIGYGEKFVQGAHIMPESITSALTNQLMHNVISLRLEGVTKLTQTCMDFGYQTTDFMHFKNLTTVEGSAIGQTTNKSYFYVGNKLTSAQNIRLAMGTFLHFFINNEVPALITGGYTVNKTIIPKNTKSLYKQATVFNSASLIDYDYTLDPAHIVTAIQKSDIITTGIPISNCGISINSGTAKITCTDSTFSQPIPIKLHYRINGGAWSSPVNSGSTFAVSANDVIEVYATHSLRAPSNMLKATWDGTNITYDYTNIYIDPNDVDSNGNLI